MSEKKVYIIGHYITQFGELWDKSLADLAKEALFGAIENAGIDSAKIDAVYVANKGAGLAENQLHLGALVSQFLPHNPPAMRIEGACASGGLALLTAQTALKAGNYETVLVLGVEKMTDVDSSTMTRVLSAAADNTTERGSTFPGLYAMLAGVHMKEFGTTREQLSAVAEKNHHHAFDNPNAQYHKEFSIDQISASTSVADPLRLLDCSPITDGAAAVILTTKKILDSSRAGQDNVGTGANKPYIAGVGHAQDSLDLAGRESLLELKASRLASEMAYKQANLSAKDIEAAEVHDCFTIAEILAIEDLGFFAKGEGGQATLEGQTTTGGKLIINPSGGLKAGGHPVGATGVKQVAYLANLLEKGQFEMVLAHNVGGSGATAVVHILQIDRKGKRR